MTLGGDGTTAVEGAINTGTGGLVKNGTGQVALGGNNTFTGGLTVNDGILQVGRGVIADTVLVTVNSNGTLLLGDSERIGNLTGSGRVLINQGSTLTVGDATDQTFSGRIINNGGGAPNFTKLGTGTLTLTGANAYTGTTTIDAGTLQVGNGGTTGTLGSGGVTINANGTLSFNRSDNFTFADNVTGEGRLTKLGAGTLTLSGTNSFAGGTQINAGSVVITNGSALSTGVTTLGANGTKLVGDFDGAIASTIEIRENIDATIAAVTGRTLELKGFRFLNGATARFGSATETGTVVWGLTTGAIGIDPFPTISIDGGTLRIGTGFGSSFSFFANRLTQLNVSAGTTLDTNGALLFLEALSGTGTIANSGAANIYQLDRGLGFNGTFDVGANGTSLQGTLDGIAGFAKAGTGTLNLTSQLDGSTFDGTIAVNSGTLLVNNTLGGTINVMGGTLGGTGTLTGAVTIGEGGTLAAGNSPGTMTIGALTLNAGSLTSFELAQAGVAGGANNDLIRVTGTLTLNGGNIDIIQGVGFSNDRYTLFEFGTLAGALGNLSLNPLSGGFVGTLALDGNTVVLNAAPPEDLIFWNGSTLAPTGAVVGGSGTWNLTGGNFTEDDGDFSGAWAGNGFNAVFGGTGGTVTIDADTTVAPSGLAFLVDGYTIEGGNAASRLDLTGPTGIDTAATVGATISAVVSGAGSLTKTGAGTLTLSGGNTYAGLTTVLQGTLTAANAAAFGTTAGGTTVANGATLALQGNITLAEAITLNGDGVAGGGALRVVSGFPNLDGGITLGSASRIYSDGVLRINGGIVGENFDLTIDGVSNVASVLIGSQISLGSGRLIKDGTNSMTLSGTNAQLSELVMNAGGLIITGTQPNTAIADTANVVLNGGIVTVLASETIGSLAGGADGSIGDANQIRVLTVGSNNASTTYAGRIIATLGLTKIGTGTLTLTGNSTSSGVTRVEGGTLALGAFTDTVASVNLSSGSITGGMGSVLRVAGNYTQSGGMLAAGARVDVGTGGAIRLSGGTIAGTLNGARTGSGAGVVDGGSVLVTGGMALAGSLTVGEARTGALTISGGGSVTNGGFGLVGLNSTGNGTVLVTGAGSSWTSTGRLEVGTSGEGTLTIADGAVVRANLASFAAGSSLVGFGVNSRGTVLVTGMGSRWENAASPTIGNLGTGILTISAGGFVSGGEAYLGFGSGSSDTATITGAGSVWDTSSGPGYASIAERGQASLGIENGGAFLSRFAQVGISTGSTAAFTVTGTGSRWTNSGIIEVGRSGSGTLTIANGGTVSASTVRLAVNSSGTGTLIFGAAEASAAVAAGTLTTPTIELGLGAASIIFNHTGTDFALASAISGSGALRQVAGTTTLSGASTFTGQTSVLGGTLRVTGSLGGTVVNGAALINTGTLGGLVTNNAALTSTGTLSGGLTNTGTAQIAGNLNGPVSNSGTITLTGGTSGIGLFEQTASGTFNLAGFAISVVAINGAGNINLGTARLTTGTGGVNTLFSGVIGGTGSLTKVGGGVLFLNGANTYSGGTTISSGVLTLGFGEIGGSIIGPVVNNAFFSINRSDDYTFAGAISGSGIVVQDGTGTTTLTGANSYTGGTLVARGRLAGSTTSLQGLIQINAGAALEFAQGTAGTYAGSLTGAGLFEKTGSGLLTLTGNSNGFTGAAGVRAGELRVNGGLAGSVVTVGTGATLSGTGVIGGLVAQSGSTIAPGTSPGTLGVNGNVSLQAGSTTVFEVSATGPSDLILATGTAALGGTAALANLGGTYAFGSEYVLLAADGGRSGTFAATTGAGTFGILYRPELVYTPTQVRLRIAPNLLANIVGAAPLTANRRSVVNGIDAAVTAGYNPQPLFNVYALPNAKLANAFDQLSGDVYATAAGVGIDQERLVREAVLGRLGSVALAARAAPGSASGVGVWGQLFGGWGDGEGNGNAAAFEADRMGFVTGFDYGRAGDNGHWRVGLFGLQMQSDVTIDARGSAAEVEQTGGGAYAAFSAGGFAASLGGSIAEVDLRAFRDIALPGFAETNVGRTEGTARQAFAELSYSIAAGEAVIRPFVAGALGSFKLDALTESGGTAALTMRAQRYETGSVTGGFDAAVPVTKTLRLEGTLAARRQLGDRAPEAALALAAAP